MHEETLKIHECAVPMNANINPMSNARYSYNTIRCAEVIYKITLNKTRSGISDNLSLISAVYYLSIKLL